MAAIAPPTIAEPRRRSHPAAAGPPVRRFAGRSSRTQPASTVIVSPTGSMGGMAVMRPRDRHTPAGRRRPARPAGEPGIAALGHLRDPRPPAQPHHRGDLIGARRAGDAGRPAGEYPPQSIANGSRSAASVSRPAGPSASRRRAIRSAMAASVGNSGSSGHTPSWPDDGPSSARGRPRRRWVKRLAAAAGASRNRTVEATLSADPAAPAAEHARAPFPVPPRRRPEPRRRAGGGRAGPPSPRPSRARSRGRT